jgi:pyridoxine 4-dehydrogenase
MTCRRRRIGLPLLTEFGRSIDLLMTNLTLTFGKGSPITVNRLGYGAMQLTGSGVWGDPDNRENAIAVLRRAAELGVDFFDTADAYGPHTNEELIRDALYPYTDLVIATKGGLVRHGPGIWKSLGRPEYLRQCVEMSLRRLKVDQIDLYQLHRIDPTVDLADQIGELDAMKQEGKIRAIGLSEVSVDELKAAEKITEIVSVQNLYNFADRKSESVLRYCEAQGLAFIPWFPLATGELEKLKDAVDIEGATVAQRALAWILRDSPNSLPIPGTSSIAHLEENCAAAKLA